jgi:hypothetical protein
LPTNIARTNPVPSVGVCARTVGTWSDPVNIVSGDPYQPEDDSVDDRLDDGRDRACAKTFVSTAMTRTTPIAKTAVTTPKAAPTSICQDPNGYFGTSYRPSNTEPAIAKKTPKDTLEATTEFTRIRVNRCPPGRASSRINITTMMGARRRPRRKR